MLYFIFYYLYVIFTFYILEFIFYILCSNSYQTSDRLHGTPYILLCLHLYDYCMDMLADGRNM